MRLIVLFVLAFNLVSFGQVNLAFKPTWNEKTFKLSDTLPLKNAQRIHFETYRFYLSDLAFYNDSTLIFSDTEKAHLLDLAFDSTLQISFPNLPKNSYNFVSFRFGIDSLTNVSGAMHGDLDPMYGMYWSWQSGYINCKLEGQIIGEKTTAFQYHLGGYLPPFDASAKIQIPASSDESLSLELSSIFSQILAEQNGLSIMSPCTQAVGLSHSLAHSFYFSK